MTEFKESATAFNTFHASYNSIDEIIYDAYIDIYAFAADMSRPDFINLQIKTLNTVKGILEQPASLTIDGTSVALQKPGTDQPLMYNDFLVARSGPLFAGYPDDGIGLEYLQSSTSLSTRQTIAGRQVEAAKTYCRQQGLPLTEEVEAKIAKAASVFTRPHELQRTLGDYDLTAREIDTLCESIAQEVEKRLRSPQLERFQQSPEFRKEVGMVAWQEGGVVNTKLIESILAAHERGEVRSYSQEAKAAMGSTKSAQYTHMLMEGPGRAVVQLGAQALPGREHTTKADNTYGLGIEVSAPVYYEENYRESPAEEHPGGLIFQIGHGKRGMTEDRHEHGDVICDATSTFAHAFTNETFSKTAHKCEETAKKLAQGELFKAKNNMGKLHGNISDVTQHLQGLQATVDSPSATPQEKSDAKAMQSIVGLSLLIALPRWGITPANLHIVGDLQQNVNPQDFNADLNSRSYRHPAAVGQSAREQMGWTNMAQGKTDAILKGFKETTAPISAYIKQNLTYFELAAELRAAIEAKNAYKGTEQHVITGLDDHIRSKNVAIKQFMMDEVKAHHPELKTRLTEHDPKGLEKFAERAAQQVQESIEFGIKREGLAQAQAQKQAAHHVAQPVEQDKAPKANPNVSIRTTASLKEVADVIKEVKPVPATAKAKKDDPFMAAMRESWKPQGTHVASLQTKFAPEEGTTKEPNTQVASAAMAPLPEPKTVKSQPIQAQAPQPNINPPPVARVKGTNVAALMQKFQASPQAPTQGTSQHPPIQDSLNEIVESLKNAQVSGVSDVDKTSGKAPTKDATMPGKPKDDKSHTL